MQTEFANTPKVVLRDAQMREVTCQVERLGLNDKPLGERLTLGVSHAGPLRYGKLGNGIMHELEFFQAVEALAALPARSGTDAATSALESVRKAGIGAFPRDCRVYLQPGDTVAGHKVQRLSEAPTREAAKSGDTVAYVSARDLDGVIVGFDGFWRRGSQLPASVREAAASPRSELGLLRAVHAAARRALDSEAWLARRGLDFDPLRLRDLSIMATAARRRLDVHGKPEQSAEKAEMAFLRLRQRDLKDLVDRVSRRSDGMQHFGSSRPEADLEFLVNVERRLNRRRIDALHEVLDERRALDRAARPDAESVAPRM